MIFVMIGLASRQDGAGLAGLALLSLVERNEFAKTPADRMREGMKAVMLGEDS